MKNQLRGSGATTINNLLRTNRPAVLEFLESRMLMSAGQLDTTFANQGIKLGGAGGIIAVAPDGKLIVASRGSTTITLTRLSTAGVVDPTFGTNGTFTYQASGGSFSNALKLISLPDGKFLAGTTLGVDPLVIRITSNGTLDSTWNSAPLRNPAFGRLADMAVAPDGKVVVGYNGFDIGSEDIGVTRLNSNGSVDTNWGTNGSILAPIIPGGDFPTGTLLTDLTVRNDGRALLTLAITSLEFTNSGGIYFAQFTPVGTPDSTFGTQGVSDLDPGNFDSEPLPMYTVLQPDGKILLAATYQAIDYGPQRTHPYSASVARYKANGSPDSSFSSPGGWGEPTHADPEGLGVDDFIDGIAIQADGKIVIAVSTPGYGPHPDELTDSDIGVIRLTANGSLDTTFGVNGGFYYSRVSGTDSTEGSDEGATSLVLDSAQRAVVTGYTSDFITTAHFQSVALRLTNDLPLTATATGTVFNDLNLSGTRQTGEPGVANARMYVDYNNNGVWDAGEAITSTNSSGDYKLQFLPAGSFVIREVVPAGYKQTSPANSFGQHVTLSAGATKTGVNFGVTNRRAVTGTVFNDANFDGTRQTSEAGLSGRTIFADLNNNNSFDVGEPSTSTNSTGAWLLNLAPGSYVIRQILPSGSRQTTPTNGYGQHVTVGLVDVTSINFGAALIGNTGFVIVSQARTVEASYTDADTQNTVQQTFTASDAGGYSKTASVSSGAGAAGTAVMNSNLTSASLNVNGSVSQNPARTSVFQTGEASVIFDITFTLSVARTYSFVSNVTWGAQPNSYANGILSLTRSGGSSIVGPLTLSYNNADRTGANPNLNKTGTLVAGTYRLRFTLATSGENDGGASYSIKLNLT